MASSASLAHPAFLVPAFAVASLSSVVYAGHSFFTRADWRSLFKEFVTGPGRTSRLLLVLFTVLNLKSMPFMWTFRIFGSMMKHSLFPRKPLPTQSLFHYGISTSRTSLMETDYNFHKSNSTYFSDLDTSRTHLVMYLLGPGVKAAGNNQKTKLVCLPGDDKPVPGNFGVSLGSVYCSFKKEIGSYQKYELWSRVLSWDRKWMYIVTHYVIAGKVKPPTWDGKKDSKKPADWMAKNEEELRKYVAATAISKYVFKMGRYTIHPSYLMDASGLLPERPGEGWRGGGPDQVGNLADLDDSEVLDFGGEWDWRHVEQKRRQGMQIAKHFACLEAADLIFDGGKDGALGAFFP